MSAPATIKSASAAVKSFDAAWLARRQTASPMSALRQEAMTRFMRLGLPGAREESWRYTNLRALAARTFRTPGTPAEWPSPAVAALNPFGAATDAITLVMVNGRPQLAAVHPGPKFTGASAADSAHRPDAAREPAAGVEIRSLAQLEQQDPSRLAAMMPALSDAEHRRWILLNTALFSDGCHIQLNGTLERPLILLHVTAAEAENEAIHSRVIIDVAAGAKAHIVEHHVTASEVGALNNSVTVLTLGAGASIEHARIFSSGPNIDHFDFLDVRQARDALLRQHTAILGGGLVRANLDAHLGGAGAQLHDFALLTGQDARHIDCMNRITHGVGPTQSRQTARVVAGGRSRVIFNSQVVVQIGADKSDSGQSCRGLLLSPEAEIDTRPQLEIHADDVKCAHGATTGRLDPDMLFYMLSRGLDRATAQSLLVFAFLADVLTGMSSHPIRARIETDLIAQLPAAETLQKFR